MNYRNASLEVCREIITGGFVRGQEYDDKYLIIPNEGYYGYLFDKDKIVFNMAKVRMISPETRQIADFSIIDPKNEIRITDYLRIVSYRKDMARRFEADGETGEKAVWINNKFMRNLDIDACRFYQQKDNPIGNVIAVEDGVPAMVLLPMRIFSCHE